MESAIITPKKRLRDAKDMEIYLEFIKLSNIQGSMQSEIKSHLAAKYGYGHPNNIYPVIRRVEKRLGKDHQPKIKSEPIC